MDQSKIGAFITQLRKQQGLTQKQLAEQLHISVTAVCKWEKGVNTPDLSNLEALADFFQVSVSELLAGEKNILPSAENDLSLTSEQILMKDESTSPSKKRLKYILLSISVLLGLQLAIYLGIHYYNNRPLTYKIIDSFYCDPNPDHQEAYGVQKAYCAIVEYKGNISEQLSFEYELQIAEDVLQIGNIDADILYIEYYDNYKHSEKYDSISSIFLPLPDLSINSY